MSHRIYVGNASASTARAGRGDNAIKETLRSLCNDSRSLHGDFSEPLAMKEPGGDDGMQGRKEYLMDFFHSKLLFVPVLWREGEKRMGENGCEEGREVREAER